MIGGIDPTVFYVVCYVVLGAGAVAAWRWGLRRNKWQTIALWIGVALLLPYRFYGMLIPDINTVQPIHMLMLAAAVAGTLGRHISRIRFVALIVALWGIGIAFACILRTPFPRVLWEGLQVMLYFILDLRFFALLFRQS